MFTAVSSPLPLPGAKLECLRLSLNTPVVALERLPVGPASAGIALHRGARGARLILAVRSTRSGLSVFFQPEGWGGEGPADEAMDAALSFAEGMGFLFDEDLVGKGRDPAQAARLWSEFLEEPESEELDLEESESDELDLEGPESDGLDLEELECDELEGAGAGFGLPAPGIAPPPLTKFRFLAAIPAERLIFPPPPEKPARGNFVLRLLSRF